MHVLEYVLVAIVAIAFVVLKFPCDDSIILSIDDTRRASGSHGTELAFGERLRTGLRHEDKIGCIELEMYMRKYTPSYYTDHYRQFLE